MRVVMPRKDIKGVSWEGGRKEGNKRREKGLKH